MKRVILAALAASCALSLRGAGGLEDLRGLVLSHAKLPLYNKQVLQSMAFFDKASRQGHLMVGSNVLLDLIRRGADIDSIKDGWGLKLYPLNAGLSDIVGFWKERLYSEGVMSSSRADVDQENRMAAGTEPVFFRSPLLDLDDVSFENISVESLTKPIAVEVEEGLALRRIGRVRFHNISFRGREPLCFTGSSQTVLEEIRLSDVFGSVSGPETIRSCYVNSLIMERCDISRKP